MCNLKYHNRKEVKTLNTIVSTNIASKVGERYLLLEAVKGVMKV